MRFLLAALLALLASCQISRPQPLPLDDRCVLHLVGVEPDTAARAADLAKDCPVSLPVTILQFPLFEFELLGQSSPRVDGSGYLILLDPRLTPLEADMVLMHEWAHVLVFDSGLQEEDDHGPLWAAAFGRVFHAYLE